MWSGPENPLAYLEALVYKAKSTKELAEQSSSGDLLSRPVNFAQLFRPSTLLNAFRQLSARRKQASMDTLRLVTAWQSSLLPSGELGMQVTNLHIQGAEFDGRQLRAVAADSPPTAPVPVLTIAWVPAVSICEEPILFSSGKALHVSDFYSHGQKMQI